MAFMTCDSMGSWADCKSANAGPGPRGSRGLTRKNPSWTGRDRSIRRDGAAGATLRAIAGEDANRSRRQGARAPGPAPCWSRCRRGDRGVDPARLSPADSRASLVHARGGDGPRPGPALDLHQARVPHAHRRAPTTPAGPTKPFGSGYILVQPRAGLSAEEALKIMRFSAQTLLDADNPKGSQTGHASA